MYRFSFGVIWIVLAIAIVMVIGMPDVYAQGAFGQPVACPPNCPNGTPAPEEPQAWVMWAWPDNTFRSAPYSDTNLIYDHNAGGTVTGIYYPNPSDGQLYEVQTYNFVTHQWVSYDYTPDQDNLGQNPDEESLQRVRVRERLSFIETSLYYAQTDLARGGTPQPVFMSQILDQVPQQYLFEFTEFGRKMGSAANFNWPVYHLYVNWLMTNADILDAEIRSMPVVDATLVPRLNVARSGLDAIVGKIGAIINDLDFGPLGNTLGNTLGVLGQLSDLFGTAAAIANPDLARDIPIGSTLGDAIEYAKGQLRFNTAQIAIAQQDILNLTNSNGPGTGEYSGDPCYMVFWHQVLDGWQVVDRIFAIAQNAANYVITDEVMARNPILGYVDNGTNAANADTVSEMFRSLNYVKNSVDQSGEQCVEGWQPTPDFRPDTFWSSNPANRS